MRYTYTEVKKHFEENGFILLNNTYSNCKQKLFYQDMDGYRYCTTFDHFVNRGHSAWLCIRSNPYSIDNINRFAELNSLKSRCIEDKYVGSKTKMAFKCECGEIFYTTKQNFFYHHKIKCDICTGYNGNITYQDVKNNLLKKDLFLDINEGDFTGVTKSDLLCHDSDGYKYKITYNAVMSGKFPEKFNIANPFTIDNIHHYFKLNNVPFECISQNYINANTPLELVCKRCGEHVFKKWRDINKNDNPSRHKVICQYCDGRIESVHALVLKQMFKHYHPDTIEEEKSCRNPITNKILPTDIVNHRLKVAIEIQSEWHDNEYSQKKDACKREFWLNKGYSFFAPDIRDYSVLEMCQLFFNIKELPDFINYEYSNKLNIKKVQSLLDDYVPIPQIAKILSINIHRIYDAIYAGKIQRPKNYLNADHRPVVQLDLEGNYINEYSSLAEASRLTGVGAGTIQSALDRNSHYSRNYYWFDIDDYYKGTYQIFGMRFSKFMNKVDKYDKDNNYICSYDSILDAAQELGTNSYSILRVVKGERKSIKGFVYKQTQ